MRFCQFLQKRYGQTDGRTDGLILICVVHYIVVVVVVCCLGQDDRNIKDKVESVTHPNHRFSPMPTEASGHLVSSSSPSSSSFFIPRFVSSSTDSALANFPFTKEQQQQLRVWFI